jgi:hypothetical protein
VNEKMLNGVINDIIRERASFLHEVEFIREMANEDIIADRVEKAESLFVKETAEDLMEAKQMVLDMPADETQDEREISKMCESTKDMSFDEMIGITE